ncbi:hypothetical protein AC1031_018829 [Aphanomyces cochlioides]|nr:hypothetical protein AC1031_018829 [Aphanomyces cochlioides]
MSSRGFGGFPISPQKDQALLSTGASYTAHIAFTIASAKSLIAAASDGLTSNCQCDCWVELKSSRKATTVSKTKVAKSTRNPIWNHAVDFGQLDLNDVDGIKLNLKHVSGFSTKSLGEAFVPVEFLYDIETNLDKVCFLDARVVDRRLLGWRRLVQCRTYCRYTPAWNLWSSSSPFQPTPSRFFINN